MEDNYTERFATFYEEYADTYQDDLELALSDFKGFEGYEGTEDDYAFFDAVKSVASKAGSAVKAGAKVAANTAKTVGSKVASGAVTTAKAVGKYSGINSVATGVKRAAVGAAVGGTAAYVAGKDVKTGMAIGAGANTVGRGMVKQAGTGISNVYNKVKEKFADDDYSDAKKFAFLKSQGVQEDTDYSELDEESLDFVEFYSEMEDIYGDNMDEAYSDFEAIYLNDDFSLKGAASKVEQIALGTKAGRALTGAVAGGVLAQGLTSVGTEASMRRQLKKKLYNGTISKK